MIEDCLTQKRKINVNLSGQAPLLSLCFVLGGQESPLCSLPMEKEKMKTYDGVLVII